MNKRKSISQTPAPLRDRIRGSKTNVRYSASSTKNARTIVFSDALLLKIKAKIAEYNKANPSRRITLPTAKAVMRRGMGAYSVSHRPTIGGGEPNSRTAWALARLHAFMRKKSGSETANGVVRKARIKKKYNQDNDLL